MYEVMYRKPSMIVAPGAGCSIIASEWTRNVDEDGDDDDDHDVAGTPKTWPLSTNS